MMEKIVLASLGGSVGKTLIVTQCLHSHMRDARILCVDTTNITAADFGIKNVELHSGDEFNKTYHLWPPSRICLIQAVMNMHFLPDLSSSENCL